MDWFGVGFARPVQMSAAKAKLLVDDADTVTAKGGVTHARVSDLAGIGPSHEHGGKTVAEAYAAITADGSAWRVSKDNRIVHVYAELTATSPVTGSVLHCDKALKALETVTALEKEREAELKDRLGMITHCDLRRDVSAERQASTDVDAYTALTNDQLALATDVDHIWDVDLFKAMLKRVERDQHASGEVGVTVAVLAVLRNHVVNVATNLNRTVACINQIVKKCVATFCSKLLDNEYVGPSRFPVDDVVSELVRVGRLDEPDAAAAGAGAPMRTPRTPMYEQLLTFLRLNATDIRVPLTRVIRNICNTMAQSPRQDDVGRWERMFRRHHDKHLFHQLVQIWRRVATALTLPEDDTASATPCMATTTYLAGASDADTTAAAERDAALAQAAAARQAAIGDADPIARLSGAVEALMRGGPADTVGGEGGSVVTTALEGDGM
jgi:hypothetical protein